MKKATRSHKLSANWTVVSDAAERERHDITNSVHQTSTGRRQPGDGARTLVFLVQHKQPIANMKQHKSGHGKRTSQVKAPGTVARREG